jgi:hypothetical protein
MQSAACSDSALTPPEPAAVDRRGHGATPPVVEKCGSPPVSRIATPRLFVPSLVARLPSRREAMDKSEIVKLREFLRRSFGAPTLRVAPSSKSADAADVSLGERKLGTVTVDDEDGDRSFAFEMKVPVGRPVLQDYLRRLFENDKLTVVGRVNKTDSVELNNGGDFLGVISADDPAASSFTLQMAILDVDLDGEE